MASRPGSSRARSGLRPTAGRPWWRRGVPAWVVVVGLVVLAVAVLVAWLVGRPSAVERRTAELREQFDASDVERAGALVDTVRAVTPEVQGLLDELHGALPPEDGTSDEPVGELATSGDVVTWRETVTGVRERLAATDPASTQINVARAGLLAATDQLVATVDLYEAALDPSTTETTSMLSHVGAARRSALGMWDVAAIQVDAVAVEYGLGHQHVYLSPLPGQEADPGH